MANHPEKFKRCGSKSFEQKPFSHSTFTVPLIFDLLKPTSKKWKAMKPTSKKLKAMGQTEQLRSYSQQKQFSLKMSV